MTRTFVSTGSTPFTSTCEHVFNNNFMFSPTLTPTNSAIQADLYHYSPVVMFCSNFKRRSASHHFTFGGVTSRWPWYLPCLSA